MAIVKTEKFIGEFIKAAVMIVSEHIGQTGQTFSVRFKCIALIQRPQKQKSYFLQHLIDNNNHDMGSTDDSLKVLHLYR